METFIHAYDALPLGLRQLQSAVLRRGHEGGAWTSVAVCEAQTVVAVHALVTVATGGFVRQHGLCTLLVWHEIIKIYLRFCKFDNPPIPVGRYANSPVDRLRYDRGRLFKMSRQTCLPAGDLFTPCFNVHGLSLVFACLFVKPSLNLFSVVLRHE